MDKTTGVIDLRQNKDYLKTFSDIKKKVRIAQLKAHYSILANRNNNYR